MIDVRDGFKTCAYYTHNDVEDVINDICLNWNVKLTVFLIIVPLFLLQCVNKDIIIIFTTDLIFTGSMWHAEGSCIHGTVFFKTGTTQSQSGEINIACLKDVGGKFMRLDN